ncbi:hypothetical protein HMPREF1986_02329 [Oribacterium sp. oral taxon 078 str. F0263]|nr:hypothetical protein HMPREF1986_02329 [Oribacterium sp. oral taxon 078 str. F0263]
MGKIRTLRPVFSAFLLLFRKAIQTLKKRRKYAVYHEENWIYFPRAELFMLRFLSFLGGETRGKD